MNEIRNILALLSKESYSAREIASALSISHQSVGRYLKRISDAGLSVNEAAALGDEELSKLCATRRPGPLPGQLPFIDLDQVTKELISKKPPTRRVLWDEYRAANPGRECYSYSQFTEIIRQHLKDCDITMHIEHVPGDKCFLDYAGDKVAIYGFMGSVDFYASLFVATLAASGFSGALATKNQDLLSTISATEELLYGFGGLPGRLVPDNMATAVISHGSKKQALRLNPSFAEFANHLGVIVSPTRVRHPRDKARIEQMVGLIQREVLGRLRHNKFYSLAEANQAIASEVARVNDLTVSTTKMSRKKYFLLYEADALAPLPLHRFSFGLWSSVKARSDYHVKIEANFYSVPFSYAKKTLRVKLCANVVEIYDSNTLVASHVRSFSTGAFITNERHLLGSHRAYARSNSVTGLLETIATIGPNAHEFAKSVLGHIGKEGLAIASLAQIAETARKYPPAEVEMACDYALEIGAKRSASLVSILKHGSHLSRPVSLFNPSSLAHENLRGPEYYQRRSDVR